MFVTITVERGFHNDPATNTPYNKDSIQTGAKVTFPDKNLTFVVTRVDAVPLIVVAPTTTKLGMTVSANQSLSATKTQKTLVPPLITKS